MDDEGMNMMERMRRLNEESAKFDMVRINSLVNSPMKSPALHPTNQLKH